MEIWTDSELILKRLTETHDYTHPSVSLVRRKSKQGSSMCIWKTTTTQLEERQSGWRLKKNNTHHQQLHQCVLPQGFKAGLENQEKGQKDGGEVKHDAVLEYFRMKDIKKRECPPDVGVPGSKRWPQSWRLPCWAIWPYRCAASEEAPPLWTSPAPLLAAWRTATFCKWGGARGMNGGGGE